MNEHTDPNASLTRRLGALGAQPVEPAVASQHLTALASVAVRPAGGVRQKLQVAGALVAGLLIGSTGLAVAGALPDPLQDASSTALAKVKVDVPAGTERYDGPECEGTPRNRGQYLKQQRAKGPGAFAAAKASNCGKPLASLNRDADDAERDDDGDTREDKSKADKPDKSRGKSTGERTEGGKPEEPGKSECVDRGQGNAGGGGQQSRPDEPGRPAEPGKPAGAGKPDDTGKPAETGQPECTVPEQRDDQGGAGQSGDQGNSGSAGRPEDPPSDVRNDDDARGSGRPATAGRPENAGRPDNAGRP